MQSLRTRPAVSVLVALVALLSQHAAATKPPCRGNRVNECKHRSGDPKSVQCADLKDPAWALQPCPAGYRKCRTDMNGFKKVAGGGFARDLKCVGDKKTSSYCVRDCRGIRGKGCPRSGVVIYKGACDDKTDWAWRTVVSGDEVGDVVVSGGGSYQCLYKTGYTGPFLVANGKRNFKPHKPSWVAACMRVRGACPRFEFAGGKGPNPCKSSYCPGTTPGAIQIPALKGDRKLKFTVTVYSYVRNRKVVAFTQTFNYGNRKVTLRFPASFKPSCGSYYIDYTPACGKTPANVNPVFSFTVSDSINPRRIRWSAKDKVYRYTSRCGTKGSVAPHKFYPDTDKCTVALQFPQVTDACGRKINVPDASLPFFAKWEKPAKPAGSFCPDTKVTLGAMTVKSYSVPDSYLKGVTLEYSVKQNDRDLGSFASGVAPYPAKLGSKCDEGVFKYYPQCSDTPIDPVFHYTIDDSDITTKLSENGLSYTFSSTCGASGVAKPKSTTVKGCNLELCFNPIRNKCGEKVTPKPIHTPFTVTWSTPDTPKGPFCPGAKIPLTAIEVTDVSVADKDLIKDVVFKYSVTTTKGTADDTEDNIPSGSTPGSVALSSSGCAKVDVVYKAQCAAKPIIASFSLQASDKVSEIEYDPVTQAKTYSTRCNPKPVTLAPKQSKLRPADCAVDITYGPTEDVCGDKTPVDGKTLTFEATWSDPKKPAGDFCPNDLVPLPTIAAAGGFKIKNTNTPVPAALTAGVSLTFDVTTKVGTAAATTFAEAVKSGEDLEKKLKLTGCSDVTVQYLPTCAAKPLASFTLSASDSFDIKDLVADPKTPNGYTYTTKCIKTPVALAPKPGTNTPAKCEIGIKYDPVEDACGAKTTVPSKTIDVTATWSNPTPLAGPFCPGANATLSAIKVNALKDSAGAPIDPAYTTGFSLTFDILTKVGSAAATALQSDIPDNGPVTKELALAADGCGAVDVIYKPQCAAQKEAITATTSDSTAATDVCGNKFSTRCLTDATLTYSEPEYLGADRGDEGNCKVEIKRSGSNACGNPVIFAAPYQVDICKDNDDCFPQAATTA